MLVIRAQNYPWAPRPPGAQTFERPSPWVLGAWASPGCPLAACAKHPGAACAKYPLAACAEYPLRGVR